jgi:hypothetical protein
MVMPEANRDVAMGFATASRDGRLSSAKSGRSSLAARSQRRAEKESRLGRQDRKAVAQEVYAATFGLGDTYRL